MGLYAVVWAVLLTAYGFRTGLWPPPEMWAVLGIGEGALMTLFAGDEAARRRRNNGHVGEDGK